MEFGQFDTEANINAADMEADNEKYTSLLPFIIQGQSFAIFTSEVERVIRCVEIKPLPSGPPIILGIINVQGRITPVLNTRRRFNIPERELRLEDRLIIARGSRQSIAILCDEVAPALDASMELITKKDEIISGIGHVDGVVNMEGRMAYLLGVDLILSHEEMEELSEAMEETGNMGND